MKTLKRGRKEKPFRLPDGSYVNGLRRRKNDGRWVIIATGKMFAEPDINKAITRFYELTRDPSADDPIGFANSPADDIQKGFSLHQTTLGGMTAEKRMWKWIGRQIVAKPKWCAEMSGVEELAYLKTMRPPVRLPLFAELEETWKTHFKKSAEQKRRVLHAWEDFKKTTAIETLDGITPETCISYRDKVYSRNLTGKMQQNIFSRIRRLMTFARSRAIAIKELTPIIENLKLLIPSETTVSLDPQPIDVDDWKQLLAKADGDDAAMILLMLNGAFYLQEVIRLKWDDLKENGCLVTHREKQGKHVRVCILWKETLAAIKKIKRKGDYLFYSYAGAPIGVKGAEKRFRKLRTDAKLTLTSSQLRDGAATAAAEANVNEQLLNVMLGHRSGINDHYVKRNSQMIMPAMNAVYHHYFVEGNETKQTK